MYQDKYNKYFSFTLIYFCFYNYFIIFVTNNYYILKFEMDMLLLILDHIKFQVKDQFEIRQGITKANSGRKEESDKVNSTTYKVVNLSGIDSCTGEIDKSRLVNYTPKRDVSPDKLLSGLDYLISCKGEVKGYSMLYSEDLLSNKQEDYKFKGIVASNHFLVLRPRMISRNSTDEIRFLHNLLDIISAELRSLAVAKKGPAKYLTINDVANYQFNFPYKDTVEIEEFKKVSRQYRKSFEDFKKAKERLYDYNRAIADKILIPQ